MDCIHVSPRVMMHSLVQARSLIFSRNTAARQNFLKRRLPGRGLQHGGRLHLQRGTRTQMSGTGRPVSRRTTAAARAGEHSAAAHRECRMYLLLGRPPAFSHRDADQEHSGRGRRRNRTNKWPRAGTARYAVKPTSQPPAQRCAHVTRTSSNRNRGMRGVAEADASKEPHGIGWRAPGPCAGAYRLSSAVDPGRSAVLASAGVPCQRSCPLGCA